MNTIQAQVNPRLLSKASRLFTGTQDGQIIEILQNARRAGATHVTIVNEDGKVMVQDNGRGIDDFRDLLDLGGSGWDETLESSEDPAGVGLFSLAPNTVTIRSAGQEVIITPEVWGGVPTQVRPSPNAPAVGTALILETDEPWRVFDVSVLSVFSGMHVTVDGVELPPHAFIVGDAAHYPKLGCRIKIASIGDLSDHHRRYIARYHKQVALNFHGQVITLHNSLEIPHICALIDMTGEPTDLRLMLPARICLIENSAYHDLEDAINLEFYRYAATLENHDLPYVHYERARDLGVDIKEARPQYIVGLLSDNGGPSPAHIDKSENLPLSKCYLSSDSLTDIDEANAHLLAALGALDQSFVPVRIPTSHSNYSWAQLPRITDVSVSHGAEIYSDYIDNNLFLVESLTITVKTSDGETFSSPVCMAMRGRETEHSYCENEVLVTAQAVELPDEEIWYHLDGYSDDSDSYETQLMNFSESLQGFWDAVIGPDETTRRTIIDAAQRHVRHWERITLHPDGTVIINHTGGQNRTLQPKSIHEVIDAKIES